MTDYGAAMVDLTTGKMFDDVLPSRLDAATLTNTIADTAGGIIKLNAPLSGTYNTTLNQYPISLTTTDLGNMLAGMIPGASFDATAGKLTIGTPPYRAKIRGSFAATNVDNVTAISLATTVYNTGLDLTTNSGRITIPTGAGGTYLVCAAIWYPQGVLGARTIGISTDGPRAVWPIQQGVPFAGEGRAVACDVIPLAAGAIVGLNTYTTGTSTPVQIQSNSDDDTFLTVVRLA